MARKFLVAANCKMNRVPESALREGSPYRERPHVEVVMLPMLLDLQACIEARLATGAQYGRAEPEGEFTGDVSMQMIAERGARYVLCGHSERRQKHGETNEQVVQQALAAIETGLDPIVCVGETAEERKRGEEEQIVQGQLTGLPLHSGSITIAYEPVWAIGKGALRPATPEEAQEMHAFIRSLSPPATRDAVRIIYGGRVRPENAEELFQQPDIDGALVGGASLDPDEFGQIVEIANGVASQKP